MKTFLDCIPCMMSQALRTARVATGDEKLIREVLGKVGCLVKEIPMDHTPPETGEWVYRTIREVTGVDDPYKEIKAGHIREALDLYPGLKKKVAGSDDPLRTAVRLAITGNVIDLGVMRQYNLLEEIDRIMHQEFALDDYEQFRSNLDRAGSVLYIGDNAGESVFDRILIETMDKPAQFVVRDRAVINDCTREDAIASGLDKVAEIISSGTAAPGTILERCSAEFRERFRKADMIISKGQGNFEALSEEEGPVFFLLKAKCPVIANHLGIEENDIILKSSYNPGDPASSAG